MRKFASLTLHKEGREGATPRDPLSPTLSHGPSVSVQPATVIYHRSNLPGNSSHSAERSNEFVARWIVRLPARSSMAKVGQDRRNFVSSTPEFRSCLQFVLTWHVCEFSATLNCFDSFFRIFLPRSFGKMVWGTKWLNIEEDLDFFGKNNK